MSAVGFRSSLSRDLGLVGWQIRYEQRAYWRNRGRRPARSSFHRVLHGGVRLSAVVWDGPDRVALLQLTGDERPDRHLALSVLASADAARAQGLPGGAPVRLHRPKMASGKTLLATLPGYVATGREPYLQRNDTDPHAHGSDRGPRYRPGGTR